MKIGGLQKVSLIDYPEKIVCTVFLHGCNLRCGFCHNPELVIQPLIKEIPAEEVLEYLTKRKNYLDGVCISGGEPLMTLNKEFLKRIKELGYKIKIDTNGSFPEILDELIDEKLVDYVALDIKTVKEDYKDAVKSDFDIIQLEKTINLLISRKVEHEFRTTIFPAKNTIEIVEFLTPKKVGQIAEWIFQITQDNQQKYFIQKFVAQEKEKMLDEKLSIENLPAHMRETPEQILKECVAEAQKYLPETKIR